MGWTIPLIIHRLKLGLDTHHRMQHRQLSLSAAEGADHLLMKLLLAVGALVFTPACSLIFGGSEAVDTKSHHYRVVRLDYDDSHEWRRLQTASPDVPDTEEGDVAFEHQKTGTIISLNSVCGQTRETSLEDLSKYLLLGIDTRGPVASRELEVDGNKALESTVEATMGTRTPSAKNGAATHPVRVKAVVMRKNACTFDLMFIAQPQSFEALEPTFERFLKGFHAE